MFDTFAERGDAFSQSFDRLVARATVPRIRLHDYADIRVMPTSGSRPLRQKGLRLQWSA